MLCLYTYPERNFTFRDLKLSTVSANDQYLVEDVHIMNQATKKNQLIVTQTGVKSAFSIEAFGCFKKTKQFYIKNINVAFFPMIAFQEKLSPILHL